MIDPKVFKAKKAAIMRRWRQTSKGKACTRRYARSDKRKAAQLKYQQEARLEAVTILGGKCQCSCGCQDARMVILEIAHKNGDGKQHRKELGGASSYALSLWVKRTRTSNRVWLLCPSCHVSWDKTHKCNGVIV
jgi:hypothetical protein